MTILEVDVSALSFDPSDFTMGEMAFLEASRNYVNRQIPGDGLAPETHGLIGLFVLVKRRHGAPGYKFQDALALRPAEIKSFLGIEDIEDTEDADNLDTTEDDTELLTR